MIIEVKMQPLNFIHDNDRILWLHVRINIVKVITKVKTCVTRTRNFGGGPVRVRNTSQMRKKISGHVKILSQRRALSLVVLEEMRQTQIGRTDIEPRPGRRRC